ncbi:MAG: hypothetical protein IPJ76_18810 [Flavobacteriales bacterium]|nr:MAG: hypothetical protein IPJ76_18810 [Flavobacteriales bacterium]
MRYQHCLLVVGCSAALLGSCKKDKESGPPVVTITAPGNGLSVSVPDTFFISASATDDGGDHIELSMVVVDANGIPIGPTIIRSGSNGSVSANELYPVVGDRIISGPHTLRVAAMDGEHTTLAFRSINVVGAPLRFRALLAPMSDGTVHKLDSVFTASTLGSFAQEVNDAAVSSWQQMIYLSGGNTGPCTAVDVNTGLVRWSLPNNNTQGSPYFTYCTTTNSDTRLLVGRNNGSFATVSSAHGGGLTTFQLQSGYRPTVGLMTEQYTISEQRHEVLGNSVISVHTLWSSDLQAVDPVDQQVVAMFDRSSSHMLVFGNRNGEGVVEDRNILQGGGFEPHIFTQGELRAAVQLNNNTYVIALPNSIVRYTYNPDQLSQISTLAVDHLAYDAAGGRLFACAGNTLHVLDPVTGSSAGTITLPAAPVGLLVLLNR